MKKIIYLIISLLLIEMVSATYNSSSWLYQENASKTTVSGEWVGDTTFLYDGNWDSFATMSVVTYGYLDEVYNATNFNSALYQIRDLATGYKNITIPKDCINNNEIKPKITANTQLVRFIYSCYNYTSLAYTTLFSSVTSSKFYESAMWLNISKEKELTLTFKYKSKNFTTSKIDTLHLHMVDNNFVVEVKNKLTFRKLIGEIWRALFT